MQLNNLSKYLEKIDKKRERLIGWSREVIKLSTKVIILTHKSNLEEAEKKLVELRNKIKRKFGKTIFYAKSLYDTAIQEYVEAEQFFSLIKEGKIKSWDELNVDPVIWLLGTFDAIGELSRKIYDLLIEGKREKALKYIKLIEDFYNETAPFSSYKFVDNLRYKIDLTRKKIEELKKVILSLQY